MKLGFCGAHRSGKTTLAEVIAKELNLPFVKTSVSEVFQRMGLDPANVTNAKDRMAVQYAAYQQLTEQWQQYDSFVTDRTPLDTLAYVYSSAHLGLDDAWVKNYEEACFLDCMDFTNIGLVYPNIPVVAAPLKASIDHATRMQIHTLLSGLVNSAPSYACNFFEIISSELDDRVSDVLTLVR